MKTIYDSKGNLDYIATYILPKIAEALPDFNISISYEGSESLWGISRDAKFGYVRIDLDKNYISRRVNCYPGYWNMVQIKLIQLTWVDYVSK